MLERHPCRIRPGNGLPQRRRAHRGGPFISARTPQVPDVVHRVVHPQCSHVDNVHLRAEPLDRLRVSTRVFGHDVAGRVSTRGCPIHAPRHLCFMCSRDPAQRSLRSGTIVGAVHFYKTFVDILNLVILAAIVLV